MNENGQNLGNTFTFVSGEAITLASGFMVEQLDE